MTYINSITICPENVTIKKGRWYYNTYAEICPTNATCKCLAWHSSNSNVASVNEYGDICGVSEGVAVVYATAQDGSGAVGFCTVTVVAPVMVESVTVTPHSKTVTVGDTFGLSATVCPQNADDKRIRWTSCDCNIAEVDALTGCVTAKSAGNVCICANAIDGSGVHGCCEVTCNIPGGISSGTDSTGVYQTLSALSATPEDAETGAPDLLGVQFRERQDGNYDIRFVSQIKHRHYNGLGYEIHSKFGDADPVSNILCSKVVYESLCANKKTICPDKDKGFKYFVVGIIENVPQNAVASFKIVPFAISLEGEFLLGSETLFHCQNAEKMNSDEVVETPTSLSTSNLIRVNTINASGLNVMSLPSEGSTVLGQFANGENLALILETPQNGKWYAVYGRTIGGAYKFGWCDGECLEKEVDGLIAVKDCYIRSDAHVNDSTLIYNPDNSRATIKKGNKIQLWESGTTNLNGRSWYTVNYNKNKAFVTADDNSFEETTIWIALPTHNIRNVRVKSSSGTFIKLAPLDDATNIGRFSHHSEISLVDDRLTNGKWYYVYGKTSDDNWTYGWCSAEDLEERIIFGDCIYNDVKNLSIRETPSASGSFIAGVNYGRKIRILAHNVSTDNNGPWHKVLYNDKIAYVIAGKNTDNFSDNIRWFSMACTDKNESFTNSDIARMKQNLIDCDTSIISKESVVDMVEPLMSLGYGPAFVAGILANIQAEGEIGQFENSNYPNGNTPYYLNYMNSVHDYDTLYSGKKIYNLDDSRNNFTELDIMLETLKNKNWENNDNEIGFGLGCLQWSFDRTYDLVQKYKSAKTAPETITKAETIQGEKMMIQAELSNNPNIKNCWENKCGEYLNTPLSAYRAGYEFCKWYVKPSNTNSNAIARGHLAESIYAVMMQ